MRQREGPSADEELAAQMALVYEDPLGFVQAAYPWGQPGELERFEGPDKWQAAFLESVRLEVMQRGFDRRNAVKPVRMAVSSGHGIGKSTVVAWLVNWIMSTRPGCKGTVTANTYAQLETKTWASIQRWTRMSITGHWFDVSGDAMKKRGVKGSWECSSQTCREENSESFAGQHAASSTSFYIFDEASAIPDKIFEVAEGGLTDGEPMIFCFGNPTRSSGKFHRIAFGNERNRWNVRTIDSRECSLANKEQIGEWITDYGEDSDFVRVRVRGLPPRASDTQYIPVDWVYEAQKRDVHVLEDEPLVVGLDIARGGDDNCVFRFRRGNDGRSIPPVRIPGEQSRDSTKLVSVATEILTRTYGGLQVSAMFCDETGVGGPVVDRIRQLGFKNVHGVQFGGMAPGAQYANMRSWMWWRLREWLEHGGCIGKQDYVLETDLCSPMFDHDKKDRLVLESKDSLKKRGVGSPDDGDALALTFARNVARLNRDAVLGVERANGGGYGPSRYSEFSWMA